MEDRDGHLESMDNGEGKWCQYNGERKQFSEGSNEEYFDFEYEEDEEVT